VRLEGQHGSVPRQPTSRTHPTVRAVAEDALLNSGAAQITDQNA
jgi:hypothetical protein